MFETGTKIDFQGKRVLPFPEAVVTSTAKESYALPDVVHYKFSLFYRSRKSRVESAVYNCNKLGKVML